MRYFGRLEVVCFAAKAGYGYGFARRNGFITLCVFIIYIRLFLDLLCWMQTINPFVSINFIYKNIF